MKLLKEIKEAKKASIIFKSISGKIKDAALKNISDSLIKNSAKIIKANKIDLKRSEKEGLASPLLKRLKFDEKKIKTVKTGIEDLIKMEDPVGITLNTTRLDTGLELYKISDPIGVIGVIFESRPDALVQISTLCLKSGNAVILKGGSEAIETNRMLTNIIKESANKAGLPSGWITLLETRSDVSEILRLDEYIDLIIPRGSNSFVKYIMDNSNIPVLGHADGICHCYIDKNADIKVAVNIAVDSKVQYAAVCNAMETLLIHSGIAKKLLPLLKTELDKYNVEIFGCEQTRKIIKAKKVAEKDWKTEYLDYKLAIKIVDSIDKAIEHINKYGSGHTDTIVTNNKNSADKFMKLVDSGNVMWNCSTRFSDGFRYGFGAEVGISTNKIHARGPVGLDGLLIYKYKLIGNGQIVDDYSSGKKSFKHKRLNKKFSLK